MKYRNELGGWASEVLKEPYGVSLWKHSNGWGRFSHYIKFEVGNGFRVCFWLDLWCGEVIFKDFFLALFCIARIKEAFVVDYLSWNAGVLYWDILFTRSVNDWELGMLQSFLGLLYSTRRGLFEVKSYYQALNT
jgi:hypothetical protein